MSSFFSFGLLGIWDPDWVMSTEPKPVRARTETTSIYKVPLWDSLKLFWRYNFTLRNPCLSTEQIPIRARTRTIRIWKVPLWDSSTVGSWKLFEDMILLFRSPCLSTEQIPVRARTRTTSTEVEPLYEGPFIGKHLNHIVYYIIYYLFLSVFNLSIKICPFLFFLMWAILRFSF